MPFPKGMGREGCCEDGGCWNSCRGSSVGLGTCPRERFTEEVVLPARLEVFWRDIGGGSAEGGRWEATDTMDSVGEAARSTLNKLCESTRYKGRVKTTHFRRAPFLAREDSPVRGLLGLFVTTSPSSAAIRFRLLGASAVPPLVNNAVRRCLRPPSPGIPAGT